LSKDTRLDDLIFECPGILSLFPETQISTACANKLNSWPWPEKDGEFGELPFTQCVNEHNR